MERREFIILKSLMENSSFKKSVVPFTDKKYFRDSNSKIIISKYMQFVTKYKNSPNYEELLLKITEDSKLSDKTIDGVISDINKIKEEKIEEEFTHDALVDMTEHHYQEVALEDCILEGARILESSEEKKVKKTMLPDMMREALKISFKNTIGIEYATDNEIENQYEWYHHKERKYPFYDWKTLNELTKGGVSKKKLHVILAGTSVGKSIFLINASIQLLKSGCNVLYISAEISENDIIERVDGNILNIRTEDLVYVDKNNYRDKIKNFKKESYGRFIVKEYPTASTNVHHIKALLDELEIKEKFKPDFIMLDYLNIFTSIRYKNIGDSYTMVKAVAEEMRGLAVEKNIGVFTGTQTNRSSYLSTDSELTDMSESFGTAFTSDLVFSITESDEMKLNGQYLFKFLKSRYAPINPRTQKFLMGVDKEKQFIYELSGDPRSGIVSEDMSQNEANNSYSKNKFNSKTNCASNTGSWKV